MSVFGPSMTKENFKQIMLHVSWLNKKTTIIIIQIKKNYTKQKLLILKCLSVGPLRTSPNFKNQEPLIN